MIWFYTLTAVALMLSFAVDRKKTWQTGRMAAKKIASVIPAILMMLVLVSVALYLVPEAIISKWLVGKNLLAGSAIAAVCRIPMTVFEASFLGLKFTLIRYAVSLPLVILTSVALGRYLQAKGYELRDV